MSRILNIAIEKMSCEKKRQPFGPIQISSNNQITDISRTKMMDESEGIAVHFKYTTQYKGKDEDIGNINISGKVFYNGENFEKIADMWSNEKKLDPAEAVNIINIILSEASIAAVIAANQMRLPPPIPLPRAKGKIKEADTSYID
ncbi:MAG: hypothetical protein KAJ88_00985 [Candidatus Aenigmarchaeota archaeon]|nr:hypothetical protein [Candidatus Aenigmarchaeota archaeon]